MASRGWRARLGYPHQGSETPIPPLEIAALRASTAKVFVLTTGNLRGAEIAAVFLKALPRIFKVLHSEQGPFVARISQFGQINLTGFRPAKRARSG